MQHVKAAIVFLFLLIGVAQARSEEYLGVVVVLYTCNAATLSRVQESANLSPDEAMALVSSETLCVEESRRFEFIDASNIPVTVDIVKPPASEDMARAGFTVIIKKIVVFTGQSIET